MYNLQTFSILNNKQTQISRIPKEPAFKRTLVETIYKTLLIDVKIKYHDNIKKLERAKSNA
jgi:hypothetical protein